MKAKYAVPLFATAITVAALGCGKPDGPSTIGGTVSSADFQTLAGSIFQPKCVACHSNSNASGGVNLSSYSAIMSSGVVVAGSPSASRLLTSVQSGAMPMGGAHLSDSETSAISQWIASGAPNNGPVATPTGAPTAAPAPAPTGTGSANASYQWVASNVLNKCTSCHSNFSSYTSLMSSGVVVAGNPSGSTLYTMISSGAMPPSGSLASSSIQAVQAWIQNGAQNN